MPRTREFVHQGSDPVIVLVTGSMIPAGGKPAVGGLVV
jgi:hypothetical protein